MGRPALSGHRRALFTFDTLQDALVAKSALMSWYYPVAPASPGARDWWHYPVRHFPPSAEDVAGALPTLGPAELARELARQGQGPPASLGRGHLLPPRPTRPTPGAPPQASSSSSGTGPAHGHPASLRLAAAPGQPPRPSSAPGQPQPQPQRVVSSEEEEVFCSRGGGGRQSRSRTREARDPGAPQPGDPAWADYVSNFGIDL